MSLPSTPAAIAIQRLQQRPRKVPLELKVRACVGDPTSKFFLFWLIMCAFITGPMLFVPLTWIFPGVGIVALAFGIVRGRKAIQALAWGEAALAMWEKEVPTNTRINKQPVMEHHFTFTTSTGEKRTVTARALDGSRLRDDPQEVVLYDPKDPESAVVMGGIPGDPRPKEDGSFESTAPGGTSVVVMAAAAAVAWIIVIAGNIVMLVG